MASALMLGGGKPLTIASTLALLFTATTAPTAPTGSAGPMPKVGMTAWYDASALSGGSFNSLADKSGANGPSANANNATAFPRSAGFLSGIYQAGHYYDYPYNYAYVHPIIKDYSVDANGVAAGANSALTVCLVWSRPNQRQPNATLVNDTVSLLTINGTAILSMTGNGDGNDTLVLFPNGAAQSIGKLELRHTHSARVAFSGATLDVWLDGVKVVAGASNSLTLGTAFNMSFLSAAQCIFHEAAAWSHALSADEHVALTSYLSRWPLGPRRAAHGVVIGQSNAAKMVGMGTTSILANRVAYLTGCISASVFMNSGGNGQLRASATCFSGDPMYRSGDSLFLQANGGDPSTWALGNEGASVMTALDAMTQDQRDNLRYVAWFWSESLSSTTHYSDKATSLAAHKRAFALIRAHLGVSAARLPVLVVDPLPFYNDEGAQTLREVFRDLVNDSTQNVHFMLAQSGDAIGEGDSWDNATGLESGGGNSAHRDDTGETSYVRRFAIPVARAVIAANAAAGTPDTVTAIDPSIPLVGGPSVVSAKYEGTTYASTGTVLVTLAHDGGNDIAVPLRAALGVGWTVMDGVNASTFGNPGTPGALIRASACARVSSTQVRVTLNSLPAYTSAAQIYYNYGSGLDGSAYAAIGQGNAIVDNFSAVQLTAGWQIGIDLGSVEQPNHPLQSTSYGIALSGG